MKRCPEKARQEILIRYMCGDTPQKLSEEFGIHVATVYRWINTWENETGKHLLTELPLQEMGMVLEYVKGLKQQLEGTERALAIIHESRILQTIPLQERLNMAMLLHRKGIEAGKRKVNKLMKQMGLLTNQGTAIYYSPTCMSHMEEVDDVKILW